MMVTEAYADEAAKIIDTSTSDELIDYEGGLCQQQDHLVENFDRDKLFQPGEEEYLRLCLGMEFESVENAKLWYNEYARHVGFSIRTGRNERSRRNHEIISQIFVCFKEGARDKKHLNRKDRIRKERPNTRVGCKAMIMIKKRGPNKWVLVKFVEKHNHVLAGPDRVSTLRSHRHPSNTMKCPKIGVSEASVSSDLFDESVNKNMLKTQLPMEEQIAELYTRTTFLKFQEELCASLCYLAIKYKEDGELHLYQVTKFGDESNSHAVTLDVSNIRASCTCLMFEFERILCRHALIVFRMINIMVLPSHYIFRWYLKERKEVSTNGEFGDYDIAIDYHKSYTLRYADLCQRAIKYAEEGATSADAYNVAVFALERSMEEIHAAKRSNLTNPCLFDLSDRYSESNHIVRGAEGHCLSDGTIEHDLQYIPVLAGTQIISDKNTWKKTP